MPNKLLGKLRAREVVLSKNVLPDVPENLAPALSGKIGVVDCRILPSIGNLHNASQLAPDGDHSLNRRERMRYDGEIDIPVNAGDSECHGVTFFSRQPNT